jgi:hypothetical protein
MRLSRLQIIVDISILESRLLVVVKYLINELCERVTIKIWCESVDE